jgi:hypothetical protein
VAELLGSMEHKHRNDTTHGRQVMGNLVNEFENRCDVPAALHSPLKSTQEHPARGKVRTISAFAAATAGAGRITSKDDSVLAAAGGRRAQPFSSGQVGQVLGFESRPQTSQGARSSQKLDNAQEREGIFGAYTVRAASTGRSTVRPHSAQHTLNRECLERSSVASVLGCNREDGSFPTKGAQLNDPSNPSELNARLNRRNSFGTLSRDYRSTSVASVMGSSREDVSGRASNLAIN